MSFDTIWPHEKIWPNMTWWCQNDLQMVVVFYPRHLVFALRQKHPLHCCSTTFNVATLELDWFFKPTDSKSKSFTELSFPKRQWKVNISYRSLMQRPFEGLHAPSHPYPFDNFSQAFLRSVEFWKLLSSQSRDTSTQICDWKIFKNANDSWPSMEHGFYPAPKNYWKWDSREWGCWGFIRYRFMMFTLSSLPSSFYSLSPLLSPHLSRFLFVGFALPCVLWWF